MQRKHEDIQWELRVYTVHTLLARRKGGHCTTDTSPEEYGTNNRSFSLAYVKKQVRLQTILSVNNTIK